VGLLGLVGITRRRSFVAIGTTDIDVHFGWAHFRFARDAMAGASRVRGSWGYGVGIHTNYVDRLIVNGSLANLVEIRFSPPQRAWMLFPIRCQRLIVSLEDPEGFMAALAGPVVR
jgi:hypothetical protein